MLGTTRVAEITEDLLEDRYFYHFNNTYRYNDVKKGKLSVRSLQNTGKLVKQMLDFATMSGIIRSNPHTDLNVNKLQINLVDVRDVIPYEKTDQEIITDYCFRSDSYLDTIFIFGFATGMRLGEILGLEWDRIDFVNKKIRIDRSAIPNKGRPIIVDRVKTKSSKRTIKINDNTIKLLQSIKHKQDRSKNKYNLVFPNSEHNVRSESNVRRQLMALCKKLNIPYLSFHAIRHSWATRAIEQGIEIKAISQHLGHSSVAFTCDIYIHIMEEFQSTNIDKLNFLTQDKADENSEKVQKKGLKKHLLHKNYTINR